MTVNQFIKSNVLPEYGPVVAAGAKPDEGVRAGRQRNDELRTSHVHRRLTVAWISPNKKASS